MVVLPWFKIAFIREVLPAPYKIHKLQWLQNDGEKKNASQCTKQYTQFSITSMPISRTLRVLTWTSFATVEKSVVQNTTKSLRPSGWTKFSSISRDLFFNFRSTEFGSMERKAGINVSSHIWCFGGRFNGAPIVIRNLCISCCNSCCEEYVGGEGKDSTVVEHLVDQSWMSKYSSVVKLPWKESRYRLVVICHLLYIEGARLNQRNKDETEKQTTSETTYDSWIL